MSSAVNAVMESFSLDIFQESDQLLFGYNDGVTFLEEVVLEANTNPAKKV